MIVKLTGLQRRAILNWVDDKMYAAIESGSAQRFEGTKWWWIEMPAIAWRQVVDSLSPRLYGPRGGFRAPSEPLRRALKSVQTELSRLEHHPALSRGSLMGWHHEDIPAWKIPGIYNLPPVGMTTHTYSIYPDYDPTGEFVILTAHHSTVRGHQVTTWAPGLGREGARTHQEAEHLAFHVGHPA